MHVSLIRNHWGPRLISRMPRLRFGTVHFVNNYVEDWVANAIGIDDTPTLLSENNYYEARSNREVVKYWSSGGNLTTFGDHFANGAYFVESGSKDYVPPYPYNCAPADEALRDSVRRTAGWIPVSLPPDVGGSGIGETDVEASDTTMLIDQDLQADSD
ncbi:hypothetical protein KFL_000120355 [Klebsormidium nitens]|uniref:Pectate lyase n=1 Tax=Klebsormidium nitens TaxID=105231 RepID=A0A1Y1HIQ8_KLENI|nr:hypothetical protein KFL_000120355 [Klebsormidium nitens]|eukprot:GAQ78390.1 hypothetical protein KFL_000120355 [Klebsormidium nitens]